MAFCDQKFLQTLKNRLYSRAGQFQKLESLLIYAKISCICFVCLCFCFFHNCVSQRLTEFNFQLPAQEKCLSASMDQLQLAHVRFGSCLSLNREPNNHIILFLFYEMTIVKHNPVCRNDSKVKQKCESFTLKC